MSSMATKTEWYLRCPNIDGVLSDITGVLYDSGDGGGAPIPGSIQAIDKLRASGIPFRFCSNETQCTTRQIAANLNSLGFSIRPEEIFAPAPAARAVVEQRALRPHLLVHPDVYPEFTGLDVSNPNCVVMGSAAENFSYDNLNKAFRVLRAQTSPVLISMGQGKYFEQNHELALEVGPYMKALEYACDIKAQIVGKPAATFFQQPLSVMNVSPDKAIMIGDDIVYDVGGAQACGLMGIQVRTGKYRPSDEPHPTVTPDGYVDNLAQFVDLLLKNRHK